MADKSKLVEEMRRTINQSGGEALKIAENEITSKFASDDDVSLALKYFAKVTLRDALPVFPALLSISCEAMGCKTDKVNSVGGAITLIAGAADLHDDVIDESPVKNGKPTVFGRFGKDVTILAGDTLLVWGLARLQKECESIPREQGGRILDLLTRAILEMSHAEAMEARLRAKKNLSVEACMNIIGLKAVVPEVNMKIGAILGNGDAKSIETLGHFGKIFGIVSTIAEEFMDVLEFEELQNRLRNDFPPLPFLCAFQESKLKAQVLSLSKKSLRKKKFGELKLLVLNSSEACKLMKDMHVLVQTELENVNFAIEDIGARKKLVVILTSSLALLEGING
jgi:geranylgeranyl pyrophosphate synthase